MKTADATEIAMENARVNFAAMVAHAKCMGRKFIITRHGKPAAMLVPIPPEALARLQASEGEFLKEFAQSENAA